MWWTTGQRICRIRRAWGENCCTFAILQNFSSPKKNESRVEKMLRNSETVVIQVEGLPDTWWYILWPWIDVHWRCSDLAENQPQELASRLLGSRTGLCSKSAYSTSNIESKRAPFDAGICWLCLFGLRALLSLHFRQDGQSCSDWNYQQSWKRSWVVGQVQRRVFWHQRMFLLNMQFLTQKCPFSVTVLCCRFIVRRHQGSPREMQQPFTFIFSEAKV